MNETEKKAQRVLQENRVAVFVVAYNAEKHIDKVLDRIPDWVAEKIVEIYVIDDSSKDHTSERVSTMQWGKGKSPLKIFRTPTNQGYGGNQKIGYAYAIKQGFDIVVLLHGDGQYAPESLPEILAPYDDGYDAVFGSRFLTTAGALEGGMPLYKWLGNRILTKLQNLFVGSDLSEMHSGYRSYRVSSMNRVPFQCNADNFHFDAEIIVQFYEAGFKIKEVPIPTFYGNEICHVNGILYAYNCIKTVSKYRLMQLEIFYDPKFDINPEKKIPYANHRSISYIHRDLKRRGIEGGKNVIDVTRGKESVIAVELAKNHRVTTLQLGGSASISESTSELPDMDDCWDEAPGELEIGLVLDILEHVRPPEHGVQQMHRLLRCGGVMYAGSANVGFWIVRIMLLLGHFSYGRRGILDLTHTRLMTKNSFRRLLEYNGFTVERVIGFGPPLAELCPSSFTFRLLEKVCALLAGIWPRLFAFSFLAVATRKDNFEDVCGLTTAVNLRHGGTTDE